MSPIPQWPHAGGTGQPFSRIEGSVSPAAKGFLGRWLVAPSWPAWGLIGSLSKHVPKEPRNSAGTLVLEAGSVGCYPADVLAIVWCCLWLL